MKNKNITNGHAEIFVFTDGHSGDGEIIEYLIDNNYKLTNTHFIDSIYKHKFRYI